MPAGGVGVGDAGQMLWLPIFVDEMWYKIWYAYPMMRRMRRLCNFILVMTLVSSQLVVSATSVSQIKEQISSMQNKIQNEQNKIEEIDNKIEGYEGEQDILAEQMDDLNAEIVNLLASVAVLEEDIALKETDIANAEIEYHAALDKQTAQEEAMALQIQFMYVKGESSLINMIFESISFGQMLNRAEYAERVIEYNNEMLADYIKTKEEVAALWAQLEIDKEALESSKFELQEQKTYCDTLLVQLKQKSDNYDALIAKAKTEAAAVKKSLQEDQKKLSKLQSQLASAQSGNAANQNYKPTNYTSIIDNATGSDLGKKVAKYACQYIGNPYVYGGTSLTKGADCSGFVYRVYLDFGYTLPRTSYSQRSAGKSVEYKNAQPGDLICYDGHIGIYIGGGYIVHASNSKPYPSGGIKVNKANYRTILSVRRII